MRIWESKVLRWISWIVMIRLRRMVYRIAEMTARYKLTLDLHGIYKPTGINRTYPHIINFESVFGMEEVKWTDIKNNMPLYDVTFPYIRMMAGPVDYTPGAMRNATKADCAPCITHRPAWEPVSSAGCLYCTRFSFYHVV